MTEKSVVSIFCVLIGQISCFFPYTKGRTLSLLKIGGKKDAVDNLHGRLRRECKEL